MKVNDKLNLTFIGKRVKIQTLDTFNECQGVIKTVDFNKPFPFIVTVLHKSVEKNVGFMIQEVVIIEEGE